MLQSRIILTDMLLTFCLTAALGSFIVAAGREGRRSRALPWYLFYLFCALATLAKGLIGMVFPAGIVFFYLLLSRRWRLLTDMRLIPGLLLFLAAGDAAGETILILRTMFKAVRAALGLDTPWKRNTYARRRTTKAATQKRRNH